MSKIEILRTLVNQRLTAAAEEILVLCERTMEEYQEEVSRTQQENARLRKLLQCTFNPEVRLYTTDILQLEGSRSLDQEKPESTRIKEEQMELWTGQEGEQRCDVGEADVTEFPFTVLFVKSETDEAIGQSSQLHQIQTEEKTEVAPLSSSLTEQTNAEDCGEPEPARSLDPGRLFQSASDDKVSDSSQCETEYTYVTCKETRDPPSELNTPNHNEPPVNSLEGKSVNISFNCSMCGITYKSAKSLQTHMVNHKKHKKFCWVCDKYFTDGINLITHMRIHTGEKPFKCSICGRKFSQRGNMKRHMETHTGQKQSSCSFCGKLVIDLKKHIKTHERRERQFPCSICGKKFNARSHLEAHMRVHTGEKPFSCTVCDKCFKTRYAVKTHMRTHNK